MAISHGLAPRSAHTHVWLKVPRQNRDAAKWHRPGDCSGFTAERFTCGRRLSQVGTNTVRWAEVETARCAALGIGARTRLNKPFRFMGQDSPYG